MREVGVIFEAPKYLKMDSEEFMDRYYKPNECGLKAHIRDNNLCQVSNIMWRKQFSDIPGQDERTYMLYVHVET